jgi:6-phosphogluconolactonase
VNIEVRATAADVAAAAATMVGDLLTRSDGSFTLGLAGGSTPRATYRRLRSETLPWKRVTCWLPDERWVPLDDPESNSRMAKEELVDHVPAAFLGPDTTLPDPPISALAYEGILIPLLTHGEKLEPDVVLLGMGPDGHTASLFPGTEAVESDQVGYVANWVPEQDTWRLTATLPLLQAARHVIFLVTGDTKADMIRRILREEEPLPARLVGDGARETTWILDEPAAARL